MHKSKIFDCITFFDNNFMFDFRYNISRILLIILLFHESLYDHKGNKKKKFYIKRLYEKKNKIFFKEKPFPKIHIWENQAIQREFLLKSVDFANPEDYIFFSDPDEIPRPEIFEDFHF